MDSFDDKMKNLFDSQDGQELPKGYDWQEMSGPIFKKMEDQSAKRKKRGFWWFSAFGLLLISFAIGWVFIKDETNSNTITLDSNSDTFLENNATPSNDIEIASDHSINNSEQQKDKTQQINSNDFAQVDNSQLSNAKEAEIRSRKSNAVANTKHKSSRATSNNNGSKQKSNRNQSTLDIDRFIKDMDTSKEDQVEIEIKNKSNAISTASVSRGLYDFDGIAMPRHSDLVSTHKNSFIEVDPNIASYSNERPPENESATWSPSISLGGGTLLGFGSYSSLTDRNAYSNWLPGFHGKLSFEMTNSNGWSFGLGYNYDFAVQYFELIGVDTTFETQTVVTHEITSALSGHITQRKSVESVPSLRDRDYQTYNTFRSHSLVAMAHKEVFSSGPWSIKLGLGGRVVALRKSEGYTLDTQGNVQQYGDDVFYGSTSVDLVGDLTLGLKLSSKITALTYVTANKSLSNWSTETNETFRPMLLQLGAGLSYNF